MRNTLLIALLISIVGCNSENNANNADNLSSGYRALDSQQYDDAMNHADQQLNDAPSGANAAEALYLKGRALEQKTVSSQAEAKENFLQARDAYQQALQQEPSPALEGRLHAGIANTSYWLDDYSTAVAEWSTALSSFDDPAIKSFMLYRIGLSQQRLGNFSMADQTFANVQQQFPGTDAAKRAHEHQGYHGFTVQLATFANSASADAELKRVQQQGVVATQSRNAQGNAVISVGPVASYPQAQDLKKRFASMYPQAVILP
jgi:outer membrane protein assembly factor BamD (BamD/ComL family)